MSVILGFQSHSNRSHVIDHMSDMVGAVTMEKEIFQPNKFVDRQIDNRIYNTCGHRLGESLS